MSGSRSVRMVSALAGVVLLVSTAAYASFSDPTPEQFCLNHGGVQSAKGTPNTEFPGGNKYEVKCNDGSEYKNNGNGKIDSKEVGS